MKGVDHLDLSELVMNEVPVKMSAGEQEQYETLRREMALSLADQEIDVVNAVYWAVNFCKYNGAVYDDQVAWPGFMTAS